MKALKSMIDFKVRAMRYRFKLDPSEIRYILGWLEEGQTALDIGAHKGGYTYWLRKAVGERGRVYAFEPQPVLAERLNKITALMKWNNVDVFNLAFSQEKGQMALSVPNGRPSPGASLEDLDFDTSVTRYQVSVNSLDQFFAHKNDPVHFIKCDVEGHELNVFKGGERLLLKHRPAILFECEERHRKNGSIYDVFDYLNDLGFVGFFFKGGHRLSLDKFSVKDHQIWGRKPYINNFLFLPRESL